MPEAGRGAEADPDVGERGALRSHLNGERVWACKDGCGDGAGVSPHILATALGQEVEKVPGGSSPTPAAAAMGLCTSR